MARVVAREAGATSLRGLAAASALAAAVALPGVAFAELFRCEGPDGRTVFTDNPAACPHSRPHQPADRLQSVLTGPAPPSPSAPAAVRSHRALQRQAEQDQETYWREKKRQAREQIDILEKRNERVRRYVTWCNRGGELVGRDDAGLKHNVSCSGVRRELESLQADLASARAYLEDGLEEECRRAGCLPGWIR